MWNHTFRNPQVEDRDETHGVAVVHRRWLFDRPIDWGVRGDMVEQAVHRAEAREHIGKQTAARLRVHLYDRTRTKRTTGGE
jgi:hypothetical protein